QSETRRTATYIRAMRRQVKALSLEKGEIAIVSVQFVALVGLVFLLSIYAPGESAQSSPSITSVYWGQSSLGVGLHYGQLTKVSLNESTITAYFNVAYSTQVSAVAASRLCVNSNSSAGVSTTYTTLSWGHDSSKGADYVFVSPTVQLPGWDCTYTIKVTDGLSQTTTWLGTVQLLA
ncbi:MAG: hypothetical protein OK455_08800, partial [Thaumarchaeota archaeon]|nr:hypothetical protein [Nitrososphaerota archaeon]